MPLCPIMLKKAHRIFAPLVINREQYHTLLYYWRSLGFVVNARIHNTLTTVGIIDFHSELLREPGVLGASLRKP